MRISDWSSDVCSSDLPSARGRTRLQALPFPECLHQAIAYIPKANTRRQLRTDFGLIQSRTGVRYDDPHVFTGGLRDDGNFRPFFFLLHFLFYLFFPYLLPSLFFFSSSSRFVFFFFFFF